MHDSLWNPAGFDLFEFIGKNAASRRARGRFLLFTNQDDIFSPQLIQTIARKELKEDVMYSAVRETLSNHVPVGHRATAESMQRFVEESKIIAESYWTGHRASCLGGPQDPTKIATGPSDHYTNAAGDFFLVSRFVSRCTCGSLCMRIVPPVSHMYVLQEDDGTDQGISSIADKHLYRLDVD